MHDNAVLYSNSDYGFNFTLPESWQDYSIVTGQWQGDGLGETPNEKGALLSIRHPLWTAEIPRQDIPIMVFTLSQWDLVQEAGLAVGAAPIPPKELGRNSKYVFALPARYNFAFPPGYEEVEKIMENNPLRTFNI